MANNIGFKVITGVVYLRNSYLYEPHKFNENSDPKYTTTVIIPREEVETIKDVKTAVHQARNQELLKNKTFGQLSFTHPLKNGNDSTSLDIIFKDNYYLNAYSYYQPGVVDENKIPLPKHNIPNGICARVSLLFQSYSKNGNDGISCILLNVQLLKERFDPSKFLPKAADDFS